MSAAPSSVNPRPRQNAGVESFFEDQPGSQCNPERCCIAKQGRVGRGRVGKGACPQCKIKGCEYTGQQWKQDGSGFKLRVSFGARQEKRQQQKYGKEKTIERSNRARRIRPMYEHR